MKPGLDHVTKAPAGYFTDRNLLSWTIWTPGVNLFNEWRAHSCSVSNTWKYFRPTNRTPTPHHQDPSSSTITNDLRWGTDYSDLHIWTADVWPQSLVWRSDTGGEVDYLYPPWSQTDPRSGSLWSEMIQITTGLWSCVSSWPSESNSGSEPGSEPGLVHV